jgi:hypothetical protein
MAGSTGTLILAAVIAVAFFFASPGVIWTFPQNNLVKDKPSATSQKANKVNVMIHAAVFGVVMAFGLPIIQGTVGKL